MPQTSRARMKHQRRTKPGKDLLLGLHSALNGRQLWQASERILTSEFSNRMIVFCTCFEEHIPFVVQRSSHAPVHDQEWWMRNFASHPLMHVLSEQPDLKYHRVTDFIPVEEILEHPYYREFMEPEGWLFSVGMFFREVERGRLIGLLGINRQPNQGEFTEEEMARIAELHPHFEVAFRRVSALARHQISDDLLHAIFKRSDEALAVLALNGEILFINEEGRRACLEWNHETSGRPSPLKLSLAEIPGEVLQACAATAQSVGRATPPHGRPDFVEPFTVSASSSANSSASVEWLRPSTDPIIEPVFCVRFQTTSIDAELPKPAEPLSRLSLLTASERMAATHAARGLSNKEIADRLGKSPATVKTQLEQVYRKLRIAGRGALPGLLLSGKGSGLPP